MKTRPAGIFTSLVHHATCGLAILGGLYAGDAAETSSSSPPPDYRFKSEILLENIPQPMGLKIAPDGRIFFNEYRGKLKIYHPDTGRTVEAGDLKVWAEQENGFLGFALDPGFASNSWIYCLYSPPDYPGQYLSRFTMKGDQLDLTTEKRLLKFEEQRRECCHHAGSVEFGPDGCLYFSAGDNTNPFNDSDGYAPIDPRPGREPWDARRTAGNTNSWNGKILRIRVKPDGTYEIPRGNLFPPGTPNTIPEIFVMGCRNPWRISIDPKTGIVYWGEVGPDAQDDGPRGPRGYDEINQARKAGNFGWPFFVGPNLPYSDYDFVTQKPGPKFDPLHPVNSSPNNTGLRDLPPAQPALIFWPYKDSPEFPMVGKGGRTACAGPVFHYQKEYEKTGGFPQEFDNCLLFWDWERRFVKWARLDKNSNLLGIEPFSNIIKQGDAPVKRVVSARFGQDGCLYLLDYGETWGANKDSKLVKISYQYGALAPIARASATPASGHEPITVNLSSKGSRDLAGDPLSFEWRLQPGNQLLSTDANTTVTLVKPDNYSAELRVTNSHRLASTTTVVLAVGNTPPIVKFQSPSDGDFYTPGKPIPFRVLVTDAEDGTSATNPDDFEIRTLVSGMYASAAGQGEMADRGYTLMKQSNCFNCHAVEQKIVGPPLLDVAAKYRGQPGTLDATAQRVVKGSTGVWGNLPMLPHPELTLDEVHIMLQWVFSLEKGKRSATVLRGLSGEITPHATDQLEDFLLEATYTDHGRKPVEPASGSAAITLHQRRQSAERGKIRGPKVAAAENGGGHKIVASIHHGHSIRFSRLNLDDVGSITVRAVSGGPGGDIEIWAGADMNDLIATINVPNTGGWKNWTEIKADLTSKQPIGKTDVKLLFVNPGKRDLMNLDWIQFNPR